MLHSAPHRWVHYSILSIKNSFAVLGSHWARLYKLLSRGFTEACPRPHNEQYARTSCCSRYHHNGASSTKNGQVTVRLSPISHVVALWRTEWSGGRREEEVGRRLVNYLSFLPHLAINCSIILSISWAFETHDKDKKESSSTAKIPQNNSCHYSVGEFRCGFSSCARTSAIHRWQSDHQSFRNAI